MSRYQFINNTLDPDKRLEVAYGFDRPLQEYFIQVFDLSAPDTDEDDVHCILWEGSRMTGKSNSEMLDLYKKYGVPEKHLTAVALDLEF